MLYNAERKKKFLAIAKSERANALFESISAMESKLETDVADADYEELETIVSQISVSTISSYYSYINALNEYIEYEIQCGNSKQRNNYTQQVSQIIINNMQTNIYKCYPKNPDDLIAYLDSAFGKPETNGACVRYYAAIILIYCGFTKKQIINLSYNDLDFSLLPTDDYYIYPEFIKAIKASYLSTEHPTRGGGVFVYPANIDKKIIQDRNNNFFVNCAHLLIEKRPSDRRHFTLTRIGKAGSWYKRCSREIASVSVNTINGQQAQRDYYIYKTMYYE